MHIELDRLPLIAGVLELAEAGVVTGASGRNWDSYGAEISLPAGCSAAHQALLCDPQTSGGLLVSCTPEAEADVLACFARQGFTDARTIGRMSEGSGLEVR
jgi:selenide, water dikinase